MKDDTEQLDVECGEDRNQAPNMPNNQTALASPETKLVQSIGVPISTYRAATRGDRGPRRFKIGKMWFVLHEDWEKWLRKLAETGGLGCVP